MSSRLRRPAALAGAAFEILRHNNLGTPPLRVSRVNATNFAIFGVFAICVSIEGLKIEKPARKPKK